jgi:hypothetical protein
VLAVFKKNFLQKKTKFEIEIEIKIEIEIIFYKNKK